MNDRCAFILHAYTRPEKSAEFEALFAGYVDASRAEEGCLEYHMLRDALPHMRNFREQRMDFLTRDFEIRPVEMVSASSARG